MKKFLNHLKTALLIIVTVLLGLGFGWLLSPADPDCIRYTCIKLK